ncbi:MAG: hypothetical protein IJ094_04735 [Bacilli bacterium]|nr:hypothetical protein [Bacilli bacterium]
MKKFTADFETSTWLSDESFVWAWALCEIGNTDNLRLGNSIDTFFETIRKEANPIILFHNLKFDGEFILYYLLKNGYEYVDKKERRDKTFSTLISDMGLFYQIEVYFEVGKKTKKVTFIDSLKIINQSVDDIARTFNLEEQKLKIDYNLPREKGHILTQEEKDYIKNDVVIVAKAMEHLYSMGLTKMTAGSNALYEYKNIMSLDKFNRIYTKLTYEADKDLRQAYKGGFTYLNPIYEEADVGTGEVLDVNSLYPSVMYNSLLPFGEPFFYEGKYEYDVVYPLYIQRITCSFKLKEGRIPTIQIKHRQFIDNEYLTSSNDEIVALTLTNVDLELFLEQYDVEDLVYVSGWKFKAMHGLFREYIDKWIQIKNESTLSGNKGMRQIAKIMLNSLYGKFATGLDVQSKIPYLEDDIVRYKLSEKSTKDGVYLPMGAFITAYAREKTIRTSQAIKTYSLEKYGKDLYCYSDTDSIHTLLPIEELKQFCEIDDVKLGAWKHESHFTKARFIRQKTYIEEINGKMNITCAGLPKRCYDQVEWNNFRVGLNVDGKLSFKHVKGGVNLVETQFTIKEDKKLKNSIKNFKNMV